MSSIFQTNQRLIALVEGMFESGVIQVNASEGFLLASGKRSPVYLDHRKLFGHPQLREDALQVWVRAISERLDAMGVGGKDVAFAGTATAGIAPGFGLAQIFKAPFVYVRSKPKEHGLGQQIEGANIFGKSVVVVDDMVTTGGSLLKACQVLREFSEASRRADSSQQFEVVLATSFTGKSPEQDGAEMIKEAHDSMHAFPYLRVFSLHTILKIGKETKMLTDIEHAACQKWLVS